MFRLLTALSPLLIKRISILLVVFSSQTLISSQIFAAPTIPDAATPGGALPRISQEREPIPKVDGVLEIPKVIDRPLGADEGERVKVTEFTLKGVQTLEEYGIREEDIAFIAEANRVRRQRLDEEDTGGFTTDEVDGIAEFIRRLVEEPTQRPTSSELWKLVFKLRNSEWSRGLTIGQIQEIADEITRYYRQHGLILATAFIPAQDVTEGKVVIEVLEGRLGDARTESNSMYSSKVILRSFEPLKGQVIHKDKIETGLLYLSDYPGLNVSGIFQPGKEHGDSELLIKVLDERRFNGAVQVDNHGSEFTGEYRARIDFSVNNPAGIADRFGITLLKSLDPEKSNHDGIFGSVNYQLPIYRNDWQFGVNASHNEFKVGENFEKDDITGESTVFGIHIKKYFHRHRAYNIFALGGINRKHAKVDLALSNVQTSDYDVAKLELGFDHIDTRFAGINVGVVQFFQGIGTRLGADGFSDSTYNGGFQKLSINYSRLQTLYSNSSLLLSTQFQYSFDRLNSLEQFPLGGADNVRAFPVSEYLRDIAYSASLEWILNAPGFADKVAFAGRRWSEIFNVSLFYDIGGGRLVDTGESKSVDLQGAGIAVKFNLPNKFTAKLQAATVLGSTKPINNGSQQYYFDLIYYFL